MQREHIPYKKAGFVDYILALVIGVLPGFFNVLNSVLSHSDSGISLPGGIFWSRDQKEETIKVRARQGVVDSHRLCDSI